MFYDRGNHHEFTTLVKELAAPGDLLKSTVFEFDFQNVEKQHETYTGINVQLRYAHERSGANRSYFVRVTIVRRLSDIVKEQDIAVHTLSSYPDMNNRCTSLVVELTCSIKMEVGIEDCLHIEFEYNKSKCVSCTLSFAYSACLLSHVCCVWGL